MIKSLGDWDSYVQQLAGEDLRSKGINANTQMFADALLDEGYEMSDIEQIVLFFVRQFCRTGQKIPEGGAFDMMMMAKTDPECQNTEVLSEELVDQIAANPPDEGEDDVDQQLKIAGQLDEQE